MSRRSEYIKEIQYWMDIFDRRWWNEEEGLYEGLGMANVSLLPPLVVLGLEGDAAAVKKIVDIMKRMNQTPPWDDVYHYWNERFDQLGAAPHPGSTILGIPLAAVIRHARDLRLPQDLVSATVDKLDKMCARWARFVDRARAHPYPIGTDREGKEVDTTARRAEFHRKGLPEDLRWMEEAGPDGQNACLRPSAQAYLATGDERFWKYTQRLWERTIDRVEGGKPYPFQVIFDPDWSWIYFWPQPTSRYECAVYAIHGLSRFADVVRIARGMDRGNPAWEEFIRNWSSAVLTRAMMMDGSVNLVLNPYGWERSRCLHAHSSFALHSLIPLADLTVFPASELKYIVDQTLDRYREWRPEDNFFPPHLGLKGGKAEIAGSLSWLPSDLGLMLLTNEEAVEVEAKKPEGCLSGLAWAQKHFVMQTPNYWITVVGAGINFFPDRGMQDAGMVTAGGEYVLQIPGGEYLTPLSNFGRAVLQAGVNGQIIRSSDLTFFNKEDHAFDMAVILDGKRIERGEEYGPPPYDPRTQELDLEVSFGKYGIRLTRRFHLTPEQVEVTDSLEALEDVTVEFAFSRLPIITVGPRGEEVSIKGRAHGKELEIVPPCHILYPHPFPDQDIIQSLRSLEYLEIRYPNFGMKVSQLSQDPIRLRISKGEWQENKRMRVDGKNLDYIWVYEPTKLLKGQHISFQYEIRVIKGWN